MSRFLTLARTARTLATIARPAVAAAARFPAAIQPQSRQLHSSIVSLNNAKRGLIKQLKKEITEEQEQGEPPRFTPKLRDFDVKHTIGSPVTEFHRRVDEETNVVITLNLNDCVMEEGDEYEEGEESPTPLPTITINVSNVKGNTLVLQGYVREGRVEITRSGVRSKDVSAADEHTHTYLTNFEFIDEELANSVDAYLESLGVDEEFLLDLEGYTADKEYAEYTNWLGSFKKFLEE